MAEWRTLSSKIVYETPWMKVKQDEVLNQNGKPLTYSYMERPHSSVFVVAADNLGRILLERIYRHTIGKRIWQIPAGYMETGEDPATAGKRELLEETGFESDDWQHLGQVYQAVSTGNIPVHVALAKDIQRSTVEIGEDEGISELMLVDEQKLNTMIIENTLVHSTDIAAITMARLHGIT